MARPPAALTEAQAAGVASLPRFYACQDVIDLVFGGDTDAFTQAWCAGVIPPHVWKACEAAPGPIDLNRLLLRRIVQLLSRSGPA